MATEHQLAANRANALKSTGPISIEGKAIVSQNALKHGLTAQAVIIQSEDESAFGALREGLLAEFQPVGEMESLLVERITVSAWRLRRVLRIEQDMLFHDELDRGYTRRENYGLKFYHGDFGTLTRYEATIERSMYAALTALRAMQAQRGSGQCIEAMVGKV